VATVQEALVQILTADGAVHDLVGDRVYPAAVPQGGVLPAVAYKRISNMRVYSHGGDSHLARPRFQLDCVAESYSEAVRVAEAVTTALSGYRGDEVVRVEATFIENEMDYFQLLDDDSRRYIASVDVFIWHQY